MGRRSTLVFTILLLVASAFGTSADADPATDADRRAHLASWLEGSFSSAAQAAEDEDFFDIRLEMVEIWKDRSDGPWLYIEQAAAGRLDAPYRQRVYRLVTLPGGAVGSEVYELPEAERFVGAFRDEGPFGDLDPGELEPREGCTVVMRWHQDLGLYRGATVEAECKSSLRGAAYATSQVEVQGDRLISWDRGYSADGEQVWGAEKGGYVFLRRSRPAAWVR